MNSNNIRKPNVHTLIEQNKPIAADSQEQQHDGNDNKMNYYSDSNFQQNETTIIKRK